MRAQSDSCDRCSLGVMDNTNPHALGLCRCSCHANRPARRSLIARDPKTYRRQELELSAAWDQDIDPEATARMLAAVVSSVSRRWRERYGTSIPTPRIEWTVEELT